MTSYPVTRSFPRAIIMKMDRAARRFSDQSVEQSTLYWSTRFRRLDIRLDVTTPPNVEEQNFEEDISISSSSSQGRPPKPEFPRTLFDPAVFRPIEQYTDEEYSTQYLHSLDLARAEAYPSPLPVHPPAIAMVRCSNPAAPIMGLAKEVETITVDDVRRIWRHITLMFFVILFFFGPVLARVWLILPDMPTAAAMEEGWAQFKLDLPPVDFGPILGPLAQLKTQAELAPSILALAVRENVAATIHEQALPMLADLHLHQLVRLEEVTTQAFVSYNDAFIAAEKSRFERDMEVRAHTNALWNKLVRDPEIAAEQYRDKLVVYKEIECIVTVRAMGVIVFNLAHRDNKIFAGALGLETMIVQLRERRIGVADPDDRVVTVFETALPLALGVSAGGVLRLPVYAIRDLADRIPDFPGSDKLRQILAQVLIDDDAPNVAPAMPTRVEPTPLRQHTPTPEAKCPIGRNACHHFCNFTRQRRQRQPQCRPTGCDCANPPPLEKGWW